MSFIGKRVLSPLGPLLSLLLLTTAAQAGTVEGELKSKRIKEFRDFIVYIKKVDTSLFEYPRNTVINVQKGNDIFPKVIPITRKSKILFKNEDPHLHNLHTTVGGPIYFNFGILPFKEYGPVTFPRKGEVLLLCDIHPELEGHVLVLQNPFFATADKEGKFSIKGVPEGSYEITTWHPEFQSREAKVVVGKDEKVVKVSFSY